MVSVTKNSVQQPRPREANARTQQKRRKRNENVSITRKLPKTRRTIRPGNQHPQERQAKNVLTFDGADLFADVGEY